jgi:uncharacterized repeat protein (TIGR04042 family)
MPEMQFRVRWPDGSESLCYSPSLVVEEHISEGAHYPLDDFLSRIGTALRIASDRVQRKYGMPCSRALGQLAQISSRAGSFAGHENASVTILGFLK